MAQTVMNGSGCHMPPSTRKSKPSKMIPALQDSRKNVEALGQSPHSTASRSLPRRLGVRLAWHTSPMLRTLGKSKTAVAPCSRCGKGGNDSLVHMARYPIAMDGKHVSGAFTAGNGGRTGSVGSPAVMRDVGDDPSCRGANDSLSGVGCLRGERLLERVGGCVGFAEVLVRLRGCAAGAGVLGCVVTRASEWLRATVPAVGWMIGR